MFALFSGFINVVVGLSLLISFARRLGEMDNRTTWSNLFYMFGLALMIAIGSVSILLVLEEWGLL